MGNDTAWPELEGWVTATEIAQELGVARQSVNKMIEAGKFKTTHTIGPRMFVIQRDELEQFKLEREGKKKGGDTNHH